MSEALTTVFSRCQTLAQRVIHSQPTSTFVLQKSRPFELIEIRDGLVSTQKNELMKARDVKLFPERIQKFFKDTDKVQFENIEIGLKKVTVRSNISAGVFKLSVFDTEFFEYIQDLGRVQYYLSNVPLPGESTDLYPLIAKYQHGWCILAPLAV